MTIHVEEKKKYGREKKPFLLHWIFIVSINTYGSLIHWFQIKSPHEKTSWMGVFDLTIIKIYTGTYCTNPVLFPVRNNVAFSDGKSSLRQLWGLQ